VVVQYDANSGNLVQTYDHHLGPVNSVLFVDNDNRFVSTSVRICVSFLEAELTVCFGKDDKKVLVWEWNIPVPIKYISEPHMHSMPAIALHPSSTFFRSWCYFARDFISLFSVFREFLAGTVLG
jgi:pre-mRNA-processing factor 17